MSSAAPTDDPRLGDWIRVVPLGQLAQAIQETTAVHATSSARPSVVFTGFPYDEGCRRNGGRPGAEQGPAVVRKFIQRMGTIVNPEMNLDLRTIDIFDAGDVETGASLESAHVSLEARVRQILDASPHAIPFVVGGSNDQSYPNAAALMSHLKHGDIGVVNIDAHLDVRPLKDGLAHSGSPFRQLLEDPRFAAHLTPVNDQGDSAYRFIEFAAQGGQCSQQHVDYLLEAGRGRSCIHWMSELRDLPAEMVQWPRSSHESRPSVRDQFALMLDSMAGEALFVSFDLDSVTGADAPGVSCPGTIGLTSDEALWMCFAAGVNPRVKLFDLSEFNPKSQARVAFSVDEYRTGRLVANMFYFFCLGVAQRTKNAAGL